MNIDYQDNHAKNVHNGKKIKFSIVVECSQYGLHSFITKRKYISLHLRIIISN